MFKGFKKKQPAVTIVTPSIIDTEPEVSVGYHDVLLVAFDVHGASASEVQDKLMDLMPEAPGFTVFDGTFEIDSWWIANDLRPGGISDCDSAVFVSPGKQAEARALLRKHGLVL